VADLPQLLLFLQEQKATLWEQRVFLEQRLSTCMTALVESPNLETEFSRGMLLVETSCASTSPQMVVQVRRVLRVGLLTLVQVLQTCRVLVTDGAHSSWNGKAESMEMVVVSQRQSASLLTPDFLVPVGRILALLPTKQHAYSRYLMSLEQLSEHALSL